MALMAGTNPAWITRQMGNSPQIVFETYRAFAAPPKGDRSAARTKSRVVPPNTRYAERNAVTINAPDRLWTSNDAIAREANTFVVFRFVDKFATVAGGLLFSRQVGLGMAGRPSQWGRAATDWRERIPKGHCDPHVPRPRFGHRTLARRALFSIEVQT